MDRYDYYEAVRCDIREYLEEELNPVEWINEGVDCEGACEHFEMDLWTADSVTGNGSGSYTFNTWRAEEYLCHNTDLLLEACADFGESVGEAFERGAEFCDVTIRCWLLGQCLREVFEDVWAEKLVEAGVNG